MRYVHRCLKDAKTRGLDPDTVLQELQTNVWGFDLNPFAAFISHFQLMWALVMQNYRQRLASFQQVESDFFSVLVQIDETVYEMFGLTDEEKTHIENRLASFPLNKLQPRYPWQIVKPRPIKAYTSDRFT